MASVALGEVVPMPICPSLRANKSASPAEFWIFKEEEAVVVPTPVIFKRETNELVLVVAAKPILILPTLETAKIVLTDEEASGAESTVNGEEVPLP